MKGAKQLLIGAMVGGALLGVSVQPAQAQVNWASVLAYIQNLVRESTVWKMVMAQTAVSGHQVSETYQKSSQQLANALDLMNREKLLVEVITDHGGATGQPITIGCRAQEQARQLVEGGAQGARDAAKLMTSFADRRHELATARRADIVQRLKDEYCTVAEARQGLCELKGNGMQGWDRNYSGAYGQSTLSPEAELAAYDYANLVTAKSADVRLDCEGVSCDQALSDDLTQSALASMVASSFVDQAVSRRAPVLTGE